MAARSSSATFSSLVRLQGSASAVWLAINWVFDSMTVSTMRSRFARSDDPVSVTSTMASASIGGFTSVAPHENSTLTRTRWRSKYARVTRTSSVATVLPSRSCGERMGESSGAASTHRTLPKLCLAYTRSAMLVDHAGPAVAGFVLGDPVLSRQPRVEDAVRDVARHFLGADQHARDLGVVDGGEVGPGADVDVEAGAREQLNRRVLQRALRECRVSACS